MRQNLAVRRNILIRESTAEPRGGRLEIDRGGVCQGRIA
jgi:hypothetical protein